MNITQDYLRDLAVSAVKEYLVNKKPLTQSVTEAALRDGLKSEQVKRAVEYVNQVAYLKMLESAKDRTFEFPLASYDDVMAKVLSPEEILEENVNASPLQLMHKAAEEVEDMTKQASEENGLSSLPEGQRMKMLHTAYTRTVAEIEKLASEEYAMLDKILAQVDKCKRDGEFIDKIAHLTDGDDEMVKKASKLVFGMVKKASDDELFYEEDLVDAKKFIELLKSAEELVSKKKELEKQATETRNYFSQQARKVGHGVADVARNAKVGPLNLALSAAFYKPSNNVWNNLQKVPK